MLLSKEGGTSVPLFFPKPRERELSRLSQELIARIERLAAAEGVELLTVEVAGVARRPIVRLVLDRPDGTVTLADCERVSRQASVLLDAYDPFPAHYTLEVTSPGLDRKFYRPEDYTRFGGREVRVRMKPTWPGAKRVDGVLETYEAGRVGVREHDGRLALLPETEIFETRLAPFPNETPSSTRGKR